MRPQIRGVWLVYLLLGAALWSAPLLRILHVESAAVVAGVAYFVAGLAALVALEKGRSFRRVLGRQLAALLVPWAMLTGSLLWTPNCDYWRGLGFFLLFPGITVVLAVALAYALAGRQHARRWLIGIGVGILVVGPVYDLGWHPQFYTYNHVFGGVLGPIYDEELAVRPGLFVFRGMTLLWAATAFSIGQWRRGQASPGWMGGPLVLLAAGYAFAGPLGINTPAAYLQQQLGAVHQTQHFDLYYDPAVLDSTALARLAADHEYRYAQLANRLGEAVPERIASYLYPDAETKARLTGARYTNVAPVWLPRPQTHVLLSSYTASFAHELVHVFSRNFGLPLLRASVQVGLVEGLAVALEPPDGLPTPHEQVISAALRRVPPGDTTALRLAEGVATQLSPLGFWTGRGAVSYTTMGSFLGYLLDAYGAEAVKKAYAWGDFETAFGKPVAVLAAEWEAYLLRLPVVARAAAPLAVRRFSVPSLFEQRCPHYVPPYRRAHRRAQAALAMADTLEALTHLNEALDAWPQYPAALATWADLHLARGRPAAVIQRLDTLAHRALALTFHLADAEALTGRATAADSLYAAVRQALPLYAHAARAQMVARKALAWHPTVLHLLTRPAPAVEQANRLAEHAAVVPLAGFFAAHQYAAAGQYAEARHWLDEPDWQRALPASPAARTQLDRQRRVWRADWAAAAGAWAEAAGLYQEAAASFAAAGDFNRAAYLREAAAVQAWRAEAPAALIPPFDD